MYAQFGLKGHNGWDWRALKGTPLLAVHDGEVEFYTEATDYGTGYGKNVRLFFEADGVTWECIYGHLDRYEGKNRKVKRGDVIGYVGNTGFSTGPHLHFGLRKLLNGNVVDYNNGYFGCVDPGLYFRKTMSNTQFIHKAGTQEYGFYVPATSIDAIKDKALNFGVEIENPDGTIDFNKAKEVTGL